MFLQLILDNFFSLAQLLHPRLIYHFVILYLSLQLYYHLFTLSQNQFIRNIYLLQFLISSKQFLYLLVQLLKHKFVLDQHIVFVDI